MKPFQMMALSLLIGSILAPAARAASWEATVAQISGDAKAGAKAGDWCKDSLKKLTESEKEIRTMEGSPEQKGLLLKMNANARASVEIACGVRKVEPVDYCKDSLAKLTANEAEIRALPVSDTQRGLLLSMNGNARHSVELACGLRKAEPYDYCKDRFAKLTENEANIRAMAASDERKSILLKMNDNARMSVQLACGGK